MPQILTLPVWRVDCMESDKRTGDETGHGELDIMAATATFTCVCGVQKASSNHWLLATRSAQTVRFLPWDWSLAYNDDAIVLCGERCAAALLSRCMGEWKEESRPLPQVATLRVAA